MRTMVFGPVSSDGDAMLVVGRSRIEMWMVHENWVNPDFWAKVEAKRRGQLNKGR